MQAMMIVSVPPSTGVITPSPPPQGIETARSGRDVGLAWLNASTYFEREVAPALGDAD